MEQFETLEELAAEVAEYARSARWNEINGLSENTRVFCSLLRAAAEELANKAKETERAYGAALPVA